MGLSSNTGKRSNQLANLAKGRGPGRGKPKGAIDLKKHLAKQLLEPDPRDLEGKRLLVDSFIQAEVRRALAGDRRVVKLIWRLFEHEETMPGELIVEHVVIGAPQQSLGAADPDGDAPEALYAPLGLGSEQGS